LTRFGDFLLFYKIFINSTGPGDICCKMVFNKFLDPVTASLLNINFLDYSRIKNKGKKITMWTLWVQKRKINKLINFTLIKVCNYESNFKTCYFGTFLFLKVSKMTVFEE
jgi:hypothetical protein